MPASFAPIQIAWARIRWSILKSRESVDEASGVTASMMTIRAESGRGAFEEVLTMQDLTLEMETWRNSRGYIYVNWSGFVNPLHVNRRDRETYRDFEHATLRTCFAFEIPPNLPEKLIVASPSTLPRSSCGQRAARSHGEAGRGRRVGALRDCIPAG